MKTTAKLSLPSRLCLNHTVQKDSRGVLGRSFRFGPTQQRFWPTSEILENIQYGGSSVVKTDSQRSRFIAREAWLTVLLTKFAFIVTFAQFVDLYSKQSSKKCLINLSCPAGRYYRRKYRTWTIDEINNRWQSIIIDDNRYKLIDWYW